MQIYDYLAQLDKLYLLKIVYFFKMYYIYMTLIFKKIDLNFNRT
jgi:hypothetical protein